MKCIFCGKEKMDTEFSIEHVVPYALGGALTLSNVCKECNSYLGANVDCYLTDNFLSKLARYTYKIHNRQGDIVNPFSGAVLKGTNDRVDFCIDKKTGEPKAPYIFPRKPVITEHDGKRKIEIKLDYRDRNKAPGIIKKLYERNGMQKPSDEDIEKIMKSAEHHSSNPQLENKICFDFNKINRAMMKIVYELSYYWLGEEYLKDKTAIAIKNNIISDKIKNNVHGTVYPGIKASRLFEYRDGTHLAYISVDKDNIYMVARIFNYMEATILITTCAYKYQVNQNNSPYIIFDAINKKVKQGRLIDQLKLWITNNAI